MGVLHMSTIAGRSAVSVVTLEGAPATAWTSDFFKAHFDKIIAEGDGWPVDAVYKTEHRYHTWPMGWDKEPYTKYFTTREELDAWLAEMADWARCEDNRVIIRIEEWDLGPNYLETRDFG